MGREIEMDKLYLMTLVSLVAFAAVIIALTMLVPGLEIGSEKIMAMIGIVVLLGSLVVIERWLSNRIYL